MNAARRREIDAIQAQLVALQTGVEVLRDQEEEAFEALPESLQGGPKGEAMQAALDALSEAVEALESVDDALERARNGEG